MTSFDLKLEMLALMEDIHPHPTEVARGDFHYWNDLCSIIGIDLLEETEINARMVEETESSEDASPPR